MGQVIGSGFYLLPFPAMKTKRYFVGMANSWGNISGDTIVYVLSVARNEPQ